MIRALIVEDSPPAMQRLVSRLRKYCPEVEVVGEAYSISDGVQKANTLRPDLVFLDIEFPEKSGFDFLNETGNLNFQVIFTTASNEYAVRAFEYSAVHYILKSDDPEKLKKAVRRAEILISESASGTTSEQTDTLNYNIKNPMNPRIAFSKGKGFETREVDRILWCKAFAGGYCEIHGQQYKKLTLQKSLKYVEERLHDFLQFFRIHQTYLININRVASYEYDGGSAFVVLDDGEKLPVSSRNRLRFEAYLKNSGLLPSEK